MTPEKKSLLCKRLYPYAVQKKKFKIVPYAFIEHQGEIHFIISKAWELDNGKTLAFNVDPPSVIKKVRKHHLTHQKIIKKLYTRSFKYIRFDKV